MSYFGIANVKSLASVLINESECTLTWLMLQNCHISGQGTHELATALHKNSTLKHLHLDHNHTGVEGASSMSDMILQNTSMKELHLKDYSIGEEGVHRLFNIASNTTLEKLWLPNCKSEISHHKICWLCEYSFAVFKFFLHGHTCIIFNFMISHVPFTFIHLVQLCDI